MRIIAEKNEVGNIEIQTGTGEILLDVTAGNVRGNSIK